MANISIAKIQTPKGYLFDGLWFGPEKADKVFIFIHGLSGNVFSRAEIAERLVGANTAALTFNNRGTSLVAGVRKLDKKDPKGYRYEKAGKAHEIFTDCADDIEGAVRLAVSRGAKKVILVGHSTGCQKSVWYLSKRPHAKVKGAVLLAPVSDYADAVKFTDPKVYDRAVNYARKLVSAGKLHEILPDKIWPQMCDAQRFLSLYTKESKEEIFTYASGKRPTTLNRVKAPLLAVLPEMDEYFDRPIEEIADWFDRAMARQKGKVVIVAGAKHSFDGYTEETVEVISDF